MQFQWGSVKWGMQDMSVQSSLQFLLHQILYDSWTHFFTMSIPLSLPPLLFLSSLFPLPRHCKHLKNEMLLQELITAVGYFCVLNVQNQVSASGRELEGCELHHVCFSARPWSSVRSGLSASPPHHHSLHLL